MFGRLGVNGEVLAELRAIRGEMQGIREDLAANYVRKDELEAVQKVGAEHRREREWLLNWALTLVMVGLYLAQLLGLHPRLVGG